MSWGGGGSSPARGFGELSGETHHLSQVSGGGSVDTGGGGWRETRTLVLLRGSVTGSRQKPQHLGHKEPKTAESTLGQVF